MTDEDAQQGRKVQISGISHGDSDDSQQVDEEKDNGEE